MTTPRRLRRPGPKGDGWTARQVDELIYNRPYEAAPDVCCWRTNPLPAEVVTALADAIRRAENARIGPPPPLPQVHAFNFSVPASKNPRGGAA